MPAAAACSSSSVQQRQRRQANVSACLVECRPNYVYTQCVCLMPTATSNRCSDVSRAFEQWLCMLLKAQPALTASWLLAGKVAWCTCSPQVLWCQKAPLLSIYRGAEGICKCSLKVPASGSSILLHPYALITLIKYSETVCIYPLFGFGLGLTCAG